MARALAAQRKEGRKGRSDGKGRQEGYGNPFCPRALRRPYRRFPSYQCDWLDEWRESAAAFCHDTRFGAFLRAVVAQQAIVVVPGTTSINQQPRESAGGGDSGGTESFVLIILFIIIKYS